MLYCFWAPEHRTVSCSPVHPASPVAQTEVVQRTSHTLHPGRLLNYYFKQGKILLTPKKLGCTTLNLICKKPSKFWRENLLKSVLGQLGGYRRCACPAL